MANPDLRETRIALTSISGRFNTPISGTFPTSGGGSGCKLDISADGGIPDGGYIVDDISDAGVGYSVGDILFISHASLGGGNSANDFSCKVLTLNNGGGVLSVNTITGLSINGDSLSGLSTVTRSGCTLNISTNTSGVYQVSLGSGGSNYVIGNTLTVPGTLLGGTSPTNDVTATVASLTGTTVASITNTTTATANVNYSDMIFTLPTPLQNVVYIEWLSWDVDVSPFFLSIREFPQTGVLSNGTPYWKAYFSNVLNDVPDRMAINKWEPNTYNVIHAQLLDSDGKLIKTLQTHWVIELIVYSLANN